jgi:hypothetical protein
VNRCSAIFLFLVASCREKLQNSRYPHPRNSTKYLKEFQKFIPNSNKPEGVIHKSEEEKEVSCCKGFELLERGQFLK